MNEIFEPRYIAIVQTPRIERCGEFCYDVGMDGIIINKTEAELLLGFTKEEIEKADKGDGRLEKKGGVYYLSKFLNAISPNSGSTRTRRGFTACTPSKRVVN